MTEQTDRIRKRLDVVEARAKAALSTVNLCDLEFADPPTPWPNPDRVWKGLQTSLSRAFFIAAHKPTVVLAQVKDYRQQIEDAEAALREHARSRVRGRAKAVPGCALTAQDRLDRLDTLTALMTGEPNAQDPNPLPT